MAAPKGNTYAANGSRWRNAIDKALAKRCKSDGQKALVDIAEQLLAKASEGDVSALRELGDRMDGKPKQAIDLGGQDGNPVRVEKVERAIIDAANTDS